MASYMDQTKEIIPYRKNFCKNNLLLLLLLLLCFMLALSLAITLLTW